MAPRVARATETESVVGVLGYAPINAVFFTLLAGWLLANAVRLMASWLLELPQLLFMILAPIGRALSNCCRRVSPAEAPIQPALQGTTRCDTCPPSFPVHTKSECRFPQVVYSRPDLFASKSSRPLTEPRAHPRARMVRDVATQSQCTYSSVAKDPRPQFKGVSRFTGMVDHSPVYILVESIDNAAL